MLRKGGMEGDQLSVSLSARKHRFIMLFQIFIRQIFWFLRFVHFAGCHSVHVTKQLMFDWPSNLQQHNDTTASLVVPLPKLDGPWVGGSEDGAAQEGSQWSVEDSGEQSLQQQHGRVWTQTQGQGIVTTAFREHAHTHGGKQRRGKGYGAQQTAGRRRGRRFPRRSARERCRPGWNGASAGAHASETAHKHAQITKQMANPKKLKLKMSYFRFSTKTFSIRSRYLFSSWN